MLLISFDMCLLRGLNFYVVTVVAPTQKSNDESMMEITTDIITLNDNATASILEHVHSGSNFSATIIVLFACIK